VNCTAHTSVHRLTNGFFFQNVTNLERAESLHFMHYNLHIHKPPRDTPAMAADVSDQLLNFNAGFQMP